jgi:hypothetical protein
MRPAVVILAAQNGQVALIPHLGSDISAACLTRPQYVLRSYCEIGSSRLPGNEADIIRPSPENIQLSVAPQNQARTAHTPAASEHENAHSPWRAAAVPILIVDAAVSWETYLACARQRKLFLDWLRPRLLISACTTGTHPIRNLQLQVLTLLIYFILISSLLHNISCFQSH